LENRFKVIATHALITLVVFASFLAIYKTSVPAGFNARYENRRFFDSDSEFIVRQFAQGKTFTHNDHLLYHILGKAIYDHSATLKAEKNAIAPHRFLSYASGAAGVALFYLFGALITGKCVLPLLCAVFAGGTAGWWFFASVIDTYIPSLCLSIPVLGVAVLSLGKATVCRSALIGITAGLAFLLRTDSVLLAVMGVYLLKDRKRMVVNGLAVLIPGAITGVLGYALLAHIFYDVAMDPSTLWQWACGSLQRPEAVAKSIWGTAANLTPFNASVIFVNQLFYAIVIPGLEKTRNPAFYAQYVKGGWIPLCIYVCGLGMALYQHFIRIRADRRQSNTASTFVLVIAGLWFFSRMLFYTWWDPFDPFLFALMSLPAIWLILLTGFDYALERLPAGKGRMACWILLGLMTLAVWMHNAYYLIVPLHKFC
jgi:hypothetical protein